MRINHSTIPATVSNRPMGRVQFSADVPSKDGQDLAYQVLKKFPGFLSQLDAQQKQGYADLKSQYDKTSWWGVNFFGKLYMWGELRSYFAPKPGDGVVNFHTVRNSVECSETEVLKALHWLEAKGFVYMHFTEDATGKSFPWGVALTEAGKAYLNKVA